jgi:hypothetical protein
MIHIQKPLKDRMELIAKKHGVDIEKVEEIEQIVWKFVRDQISKGKRGEYENILLKYLGTFHLFSNKLKFYEERESE